MSDFDSKPLDYKIGYLTQRLYSAGYARGIADGLRGQSPSELEAMREETERTFKLVEDEIRKLLASAQSGDKQ